MSFSRILYKGMEQKYAKEEIKFPGDSYISIFLKRKKKLIKKEKYIKALQEPNPKNIDKSFVKSDIQIKNAWIISNVIDFYNEVQFFYNYLISSCCKCKFFKVGPMRNYFINVFSKETILFWKNYNYIDQSLKWIHTILNSVNPNDITPSFQVKSDENIDFHSMVKLIVNRIFCIYAHCYYHHLDQIRKNDVDFAFFTLSANFFISFVLKYDLIDQFEFEPLKNVFYPFVEINYNPVDCKSKNES